LIGEIDMTGSYGATSTTDDVLSGKDLSGKRVFVTGVSAGLGVETARALAAHGAQALSSRSPTMCADHVGLGPGLIDEDAVDDPRIAGRASAKTFS